MILREKILLGLVGVAAIGMGIFYAPALLSPAPSKSKRTPIDFPTLTTNVQLNLKEGQSTDREKNVLAAATTKWLRNPLRQRPIALEERALPVDSSAEYITPLPEYIGFLNIGDHLIAIIDGKDYRAGETIKGGEFQLIQIYPDHIKLLRKGATDPVNVALEKPHITGKPSSSDPPSIDAPPNPSDIDLPPGIAVPPIILEPSSTRESQ